MNRSTRNGPTDGGNVLHQQTAKHMVACYTTRICAVLKTGVAMTVMIYNKNVDINLTLRDDWDDQGTCIHGISLTLWTLNISVETF